MGESAKVGCTLLLGAGAIAGSIAWVVDRPDSFVWSVRVGGPLVALLGLGLFLALHFRVDREPDYLRALTGEYFNCNGFCFAFGATVIHGFAFLDVYFQSQYDRPSFGRITIRPALGFFLTRVKTDTMTVEIPCPPGGFGYARIAIPVPRDLQGTGQSFEVIASIRYPDGRGKRLRFQDGICVPPDRKFESAFRIGLRAFASLALLTSLTGPKTVTIEMPLGVAEDIPKFIAPEVKVLWRVGNQCLYSGRE